MLHKRYIKCRYKHTTNKIPGEINKNLQQDENFFSKFITN